VIAAATLGLGSATAVAAEPQPPNQDPLEALSDAAQGPALASTGVLALPQLPLIQPPLLAIPPGPAALIGPPIYAKRSRDRSFDTSFGERDPRVQKLPRTHRFRLAFHAQWVRLTQTPNPNTGETDRFHFAPLLLDLGYQAQFLKFMMVRLALAAGGNVANTRHAMPLAVYPQAYLGYQGKVVGLALGYGFDWTIPPTPGVGAPDSTLAQPVIVRNHVVKGELSGTTRIDRVAMTFALALGGMRSDLTHYSDQNRRWRFYLGLQAGVFFDGTIRREKKARKQTEGR
jgi:hypothetical protein